MGCTILVRAGRGPTTWLATAAAGEFPAKPAPVLKPATASASKPRAAAPGAANSRLSRRPNLFPLARFRPRRLPPSIGRASAPGGKRIARIKRRYYRRPESGLRRSDDYQYMPLRSHGRFSAEEDDGGNCGRRGGRDGSQRM